MDDDPMKLPEGKACGDCQHFNFCKMLFGCKAENTTCDWSPSRFKERPAMKFSDVRVPGKRVRYETTMGPYKI